MLKKLLIAAMACVYPIMWSADAIPFPPPPLYNENHTFDEAIEFYKNMPKNTTITQEDKCNLFYLEFRRDIFPEREKSFDINGYTPISTEQIAKTGSDRAWHDLFNTINEIGTSPVKAEQLSALKRWIIKNEDIEKCPSPWGDEPRRIVPWIYFQIGEKEKAKAYYLNQFKKSVKVYETNKNEGVALADFSLSYLRKLISKEEFKEYEDWLAPRKIEYDIHARQARIESEKRRAEYEKRQKEDSEKAKKDYDDYIKEHGSPPPPPPT